MDFAHCVYLWNLFLHYLFIYVFLLLTEVQKCYVFWHCARLFVYVFILFPEMLCFLALCQIICLCISIISRSPEMLCFQALCQIICLCIYFISRSPEMLYFQALCTSGSSQRSVFETDITMSWINTNTVNKHFFSSSVTYRSTSRYIVDHIVWQWIE